MADLQKKSKLAEFFNFNRDNRPDAQEEDTTPGVKWYFKSLWRKFWKLSALNIMMMIAAIPIFVAVFVFINIDTTPTGSSVLFPQIYGAHLMDANPVTTFLLDLFGKQSPVPVYNATGSWIAIAVCALIVIVTFGWQNAGLTYVLRSMVRGEPVFLISDYFYAIRKNWRQGLFLGIIDFFAIFLLVYDLIFFWGQTGTFLMDVGFYAICAVGILYFFMRFYLYLLMVTFNLSIRKILKNALIFAVLGAKRNLMGLLGIILLTAANLVFLPLLSFNIVIALILPFLFYFSFTAFTSAYAAYPIIDRYMIEPYRGAEEDEEVDEETDAEGSENPSDTL